jgi:hypothetical protein
MDNTQELQKQIQQLKQQIEEVSLTVFKNNFSSHQDFNKDSFFNSRLKIPVQSTLPTTCDTGELCCVGGKLYIGVSTNTWGLVGAQTA